MNLLGRRRSLSGIAMLAVLSAGGGRMIGAEAPAVRSEVWLNSPVLTPADLQGKTLLVDFWTFG